MLSFKRKSSRKDIVKSGTNFPITLSVPRAKNRKREIEKYLAEQEVKALNEDLKPHKESLETKVFKALKQAGKHGLWNYQLDKLGMSWHRRIGDMRADGINITHVQVSNHGHKYFLDNKL